MEDRKDEKTQQKNEEHEEHGCEPIDSCGLCSSLFNGEQEKLKGGKVWRFMTEREFRVLKAMRSLRDKAVKLKKRIKGIEQDLQVDPGGKPEPVAEEAMSDEVREEKLWEQQLAEELLDHCARLANLKDEWKEMDRERMDAQEERMRLLGHIQ